MKAVPRLLLCVLAIFTSVAQANPDFEISSLKGVSSLKVIVEDIDRLGITDLHVREAAELMLRRNGVQVVAPDEIGLGDGFCMLRVRITLASSETSNVAHNVSVELCQKIAVMRTAEVMWMATWTSGTTSLCTRASAKTDVFSSIDKNMTAFINDLLKANR